MLERRGVVRPVGVAVLRRVLGDLVVEAAVRQDDRVDGSVPVGRVSELVVGAAEIRAESVFNPNARSGANAMGLMQVLPGTGMIVARQVGVPWGGAQSLYDPDTNIVLGSAYLRQLLDKYGGQPYFAIAGYNAGPAPLARWQSQRPGMDPDFWIETISYKETRDYVARVLAFSVIYDWRLNGDAAPVSDRMRGRTGTPRKGFVCPTPGS